MPINTRTTMNEPTTPTIDVRNQSPATAVTAVNTDHQKIAPANTQRGPKRSPSAPPGICRIAYPKTKALKIQPIWISVSLYSGIMYFAAIAMFTRSMNINTPMKKIRATIRQRVRVGDSPIMSAPAARPCYGLGNSADQHAQVRGAVSRVGADEVCRHDDSTNTVTA